MTQLVIAFLAGLAAAAWGVWCRRVDARRNRRGNRRGMRRTLVLLSLHEAAVRRWSRN